jgi:pimeloyl-ACP methyl ester carboxylesterase
MRKVSVDGVELAYAVRGDGEPLVLIHGGVLADGLHPLWIEPSLAGRHRVVLYHRRGYGESDRVTPPFATADQAADGRALARALGLPRVHLVGHSYGAAIALQWALDAPDEVKSLVLLEAPLFHLAPALRRWRFSAEDARRLSARVLLVNGSEAAPIFRESHELLRQWLPDAEQLLVPTSHGLQYEAPRPIAEAPRP